MVQFTLPKNSQIVQGKTWPKPSSGNIRGFKVYRWNPDTGENPRVDTYYIDTDKCGPMVLDAIRGAFRKSMAISAYTHCHICRWSRTSFLI